MALTKGINSYVTVAEADLFFADRLDIAAWTAADATAKAQALVTATSVLDQLNWTGTAISETQDLAFPRSGSYFDPKYGSVIEFDGVNAPNRIIVATYELAHHLLNNDGLLDDTGSAISISVGQITLDRVSKPSTLPSNVRTMIRPLLVNQGSNAWWRAN